MDEPADDRDRKPKDAFLAHSSTDQELAQKLCESLEARGVVCWIAPRNMAPGQPYALGCLQGVAENRSLLLLASESGLSSVQVISEVEQAHKRGKPIYTLLIPPAKVRGEMDFYLSRLHWMQSSGRTPDEIAARLASVIRQERDWKEVASPPTLRRTMLYRPGAFARLVGAAVVGLGLVLGGAVFAVNRFLDLDFRRLGYLELAVEPAHNGREMIGHAQVWLMANAVAFRDVRLITVTQSTDGVARQQKYAKWVIPDQVGSMEEIEIPLETGAQRLTTCLIVPSPGLHAPYRVTQRFVLAPQSDGVRVAETVEKRVSKEDGSACGAAQ